MSNIMANVKVWVCDDCGIDFQAQCPYISVERHEVCLRCMDLSYADAFGHTPNEYSISDYPYYYDDYDEY